MRASLSRARSSTEPVSSPVSAAKPTTTVPGRARSVEISWRMSGFCCRPMLGAEPSAGLLDLAGADVGRAGSRPGAAAITTASAVAAALTTASRSCAGGLDADHLDAGRVGQGDVRADEGDLGAARRPRRGPARSPAGPRSGCRGSAPGRGTRGCRRRRRRRAARRGRGRAVPPSPPRASTWVQTSKISAGSGSRPLPVSAPVSRPSAGSMTRTPRARRVATLARVAGCSHISVCIAGREHHRAARGEQRVGEQVVGEPVRGLGQQVGGGRARPRPGRRTGRAARAAPRARRPRPRWRPACPTAPPRWARPTNSSAAAVGTTVTSWPDSVKRRSSSQALYAAMPPLTPRTTRGRAPDGGTASGRASFIGPRSARGHSPAW